MGKRKIAIIGASDLQLPLILKAKEMGYETHVFAWAAGDVGEEAADLFYPISIVEVEQILEQCRKINPAAVASIASDLAAITVNRVANALGLPANPPETAVIATNKYEMRRTFMSAGIPTPRFLRVHAGGDLKEALQMRLPIIVKPTDRSGSRGICKLTSFDGLRESVEKACAESFERCAIIEEFIEGEEYSCECISQEGTHHFLAITKKFTTGAPHFIEIGHMEPSGLDEQTCRRVREQVFKALDALHVTCGASHSEFKVDPENGGIRLIEIGARMGGDCIGSDLVRLSTGYDFVKMTIQAAAGDKITLEREDHAAAAAVRYVMNKKDYEDFLALKRNEPEAIYRMSDIRYEEKEVTDSSRRFGFYIATDSSEARLRERLHL
jgi:biotin carboxylase